MIRLLVSPTDDTDALDAVKGGADIIDVKNPSEGSLGAPLPILIRKVRESVPQGIPISAALGDVPTLPGTIAQAALGAAIAGADYVKLGLMGPRNIDDAIRIVKAVVNTLAYFNSKIITVAALYADYERAGTLQPAELPKIAENGGAGFAMIDTAIKDDKHIFEFIDQSEIAEFLQDCRERRIHTALAGSLSNQSFESAVRLMPDVIGVRKAALQGDDRISARVDSNAVKRLKSIINSLK
jgi:uncharacterized protein (UPF0264 family)